MEWKKLLEITKYNLSAGKNKDIILWAINQFKITSLHDLITSLELVHSVIKNKENLQGGSKVKSEWEGCDYTASELDAAILFVRKNPNIFEYVLH